MQEVLASISLWMIVAAGAAVILLVNLSFATAALLRFRRAAKDLATGKETRARRFSALTLAFNETYILKKAEKGFRGHPGPFPQLPRALGYPARWIKDVLASRSPRSMALLLRHAPEQGLFDCFLAALKSRRLGKALLEWLDERSDGFPLRMVALAGPGREFPGSEAKKLLEDRMDSVRELLGDQEWAARAMALRIMEHDPDERSRKGIADSLADPHPLVRKLAVQAPYAGERLSFYATLYRLFTEDPAFEVRKAAKARIMAEFPDLYSPDAKTLSHEAAVHLLELMDPASRADEELAFRCLEKGGDEEKLAAAEMLQARGSLTDMLSTAPGGDRAEFERRYGLLSTAVRLRVSAFLSAADTLEGDGSFELAARLLAQGGERAHIAVLARRWFGRMGTAPHQAERVAVYLHVLEAIRLRGDDEATRILATEIAARKRDPELMAALLSAADASQDGCVLSGLEALFLDTEFPLRDELRGALMRQPKDAVTPFALSFLRADRATTPRVLRKDALILAGGLGLTGALQRSIEALPTLDPEDIEALAPIIAGADPEGFKRKARYILDGRDAPSRAAVIAALPASGERSFLADIRAALRDADPDVRVASARALAAFQENKALGTGGMDLLRDPVERVRVASAAALAGIGGAAVVEGLRGVLADPNELDEVKTSLAQGLGRAADASSLDLLCDALGDRPEGEAPLTKALMAALSRRASKKDMSRIVERLKDATGLLKGRIAEAVKTMGEPGEDVLVELLRENISALKPYIVEALEQTGFVEARIRELKQRDPAIRRKAAALLDAVGSRAAFRGIVLAARDPDPEVRVAVTKALERLASPESAELLAELERDPDARVRKYVLWGLERVRAKAL